MAEHRAVEFHAPGAARLVDSSPEETPSPGEAIVRAHRMGVCGTDASAFRGDFPFFEFPRIPGHELGVEIIALGEGVTDLAVGDQCALEPYFDDPQSPASSRGMSNCCPEMEVFGVHRDGGLRESDFAVPARKLHRGKDLSFDQLALVEPLAIGYHAVQRAAPEAGESVLVIGAGPIGLACIEFLRLRGVTIHVADLNPLRREFCQAQPGIASCVESFDGRADLVIDATGSPRSMSNCFEFAETGGRVVFLGVTGEEIRFPHAPIFHRRELTLLASRNALPGDFRDIIRLLEEGKIDLAPWITHRLEFGEVPAKFAGVIDPEANAIKAIIDIQTS